MPVSQQTGIADDPAQQRGGSSRPAWPVCRGARRVIRVCVPVLVLGLMLVPEAGLACPTCKQALAQNDEAQQALVSGYFYSILFMMAMPFVIVGTFGSMAWLAIRRGAAERAAVIDRVSETEATPAAGEGLAEPPVGDR